MAATRKFTDEIIRRYTPYFKWNAFDQSDIKDIQSVIDFARGLVIKDMPYADSLETDQSLKNADTYIRAIDNTLEAGTTDYQRQVLIDNYAELNPYYINLKAIYGVDYYTARKAKDFAILKEMNLSLDKFHKMIFEEAYYESVNYYQKVIYTHAFDNQYYHKEFFLQYIIFMTVQRYIDKEMDAYFNVDTYTKRQLKNGFISNGVDYFDSFPIEYQRRTYKLLNDMIRNKGSNQVFNIIKDIFNFSNISINKYSLGKTKDVNGNDDLVFFKTDINDTLNVTTDAQESYEFITEQDPYWRVPREEVYNKDFNTLNTKYISIDVLLDLLVNSRQMSYFFTLLNEIEIKNEKKIKDYMLLNKGMTYEQARREGGLEDIDFWFSDRNISDKPIHIFDAIIALAELVMVRMRWGDKIHHKKGLLRGVYGFNTNIDVVDEVKHLRQYLMWHEKEIPGSEYRELMDFLLNFRVQGFDKDNTIDRFDYIMNKYKDSYYYHSQLMAYSQIIQGEINGSEVIRNHINTKDEVYDTLEYLVNVLFDTARQVKFESLDGFEYVKELLSDFIQYQMGNNATITEDKIYKFFNSAGSYVKDELKTFIAKLGDDQLRDTWNWYVKNHHNFDDMTKLLSEIQPAIIRAEEANKYTNLKRIQNYKNLSNFLDTFVKFAFTEKNLYTMEDFAKIYRYNQQLETHTENLILETQRPEVYKTINAMWKKAFVHDMPMDLFMGYKTFGDYLKDKDPNLYMYTRVQQSYSNIDNFDFEGVVRDKIFELASAIDNHLELGEYDFILENNLVGIEEYVKQYIHILIKVFKAYTVDTIYAHTVYNLNDKWENSIRVLDSIDIAGGPNGAPIHLWFRDFIDLMDTSSSTGRLPFDDKKDAITLTESLVFKVNGSQVNKKIVYK